MTISTYKTSCSKINWELIEMDASASCWPHHYHHYHQLLPVRFIFCCLLLLLPNPTHPHTLTSLETCPFPSCLLIVWIYKLSSFRCTIISDSTVLLAARAARFDCRAVTVQGGRTLGVVGGKHSILYISKYVNMYLCMCMNIYAKQFELSENTYLQVLENQNPKTTIYSHTHAHTHTNTHKELKHLYLMQLATPSAKSARPTFHFT